MYFKIYMKPKIIIMFAEKHPRYILHFNKLIGDEMQEDYTFRILKFTFKVDNELPHKVDIRLNALMQKKIWKQINGCNKEVLS